MLTMHFMLRNWETVSLRAQETFPLRPDYTRALFSEFRRVGRTTLMGTIVTGIAQGLLATIGYWIAGVPEPIFFGAATAVASLVPAIGTMLVWVPAGVVLIVMGHPGRGIFELVWGSVFVVALSDYVIRPRLVGGESEVPSLVTFAALFGGVEVFGLKGLIVGPVLMSLAIAVLRLYASETRLRRHISRASLGPTSTS
jgi:predicted PurR-regulated permease PerM